VGGRDRPAAPAPSRSIPRRRRGTEFCLSSGGLLGPHRPGPIHRMSRTERYRIEPDGTVVTVYTDTIDLRAVGHVQAVRASVVEWNESCHGRAPRHIRDAGRGGRGRAGRAGHLARDRHARRATPDRHVALTRSRLTASRPEARRHPAPWAPEISRQWPGARGGPHPGRADGARRPDPRVVRASVCGHQGGGRGGPVPGWVDGACRRSGRGFPGTRFASLRRLLHAAVPHVEAIAGCS
jgi:hypothetical protein